tara:strand:- start:127 stop:399 length:273 start_codon:yes stop_codon:yes gene_type:complete
MGKSDFTSRSLSSGNITVSNTNNIKFFLLIIFIGFIYLYNRKSRKKSGVALLNISVSPHNEKIAVTLAIITIIMYGYHIYLESKHLKKDD